MQLGQGRLVLRLVVLIFQLFRDFTTHSRLSEGVGVISIGRARVALHDGVLDAALYGIPIRLRLFMPSLPLLNP